MLHDAPDKSRDMGTRPYVRLDVADHPLGVPREARRIEGGRLSFEIRTSGLAFPMRLNVALCCGFKHFEMCLGEDLYV